MSEQCLIRHTPEYVLKHRLHLNRKDGTELASRLRLIEMFIKSKDVG